MIDEKKKRSYFALEILICVFPMMPGLLMASGLGFYRPLFWIEFLLLVPFAVGRKWVYVLLILLAWFGDFLFGFAQINLSSNYMDVLELMDFLPYTNATWIFGGVLGLVVLAMWMGVCVWAANRSKERTALLMGVLVIVMLAVAIPRVGGFEHQEKKIYLIRESKLIGSWLLDSLFLRRSLEFFEEPNFEENGFGKIDREDSAMGRLLARGPLPDRLLLVVVESWGISRSAEENQFFLDLWKGRNFEIVENGKIPFQGATIKAEFRELCGFLPQNLRIDEVPDGEKCLPSILSAQNYKTQSFHGASGKMYHRERWYPMVGFGEVNFMRQLQSIGRWCENIPGICDYEITDRVLQKLTEGDRSFVYWLTLNSHAPYDISDLRSPAKIKEICEPFALAGKRCAHFALLADFMTSLADAMQRSSLSDFEVVLVGDHSPKFFDEESRKNFEEGAVPYLIIRAADHHSTNSSGIREPD